jgi:hypothetical protein
MAGWPAVARITLRTNSTPRSCNAPAAHPRHPQAAWRLARWAAATGNRPRPKAFPAAISPRPAHIPHWAADHVSEQYSQGGFGPLFLARETRDFDGPSGPVHCRGIIRAATFPPAPIGVKHQALGSQQKQLAASRSQLSAPRAQGSCFFNPERDKSERFQTFLQPWQRPSVASAKASRRTG